MPCCLAKRHICELYQFKHGHAIIAYYISHCFCRQCLYIQLLFLCISHLQLVMVKSGLKTRSSEQTMLPGEVDILLVTDSSSEEDSETDDQSYFPLEVYAQTWQGYITHVMHVVLHCVVFISYMDCHLLTCLLYKSYILIISCHHVYIVHTHHLSELWHVNPFNKDII